MNSKNTEEYLTTLQVVQISAGDAAGRSTVKQWENTGKLRAIRVGPEHGKFGGQARLFLKSEVIAFLAERRKRKAKKARAQE